jgi:hypothetical protein
LIPMWADVKSLVLRRAIVTRTVQDQLFTKIVDEIANSKGQLQWASPAGIVMSHPGTPDAIDGHPASPTHSAGDAADSP